MGLFNIKQRRQKRKFFKYTFGYVLFYREHLHILGTGFTIDNPYIYTYKGCKEYINNTFALLTSDKMIAEYDNYTRKGNFNPYTEIELNKNNAILMDMMEYLIFGINSKDNLCDSLDDDIRNRLILNLYAYSMIFLGKKKYEKMIGDKIIVDDIRK